MAKKDGRRYTGTLKFRVVLEALRSQKPDAEVARVYQVPPITLSKWEKEFLEKGAEVFGGGEEVRASEQKISKLEQMVGQKKVELALRHIQLDEDADTFAFKSLENLRLLFIAYPSSVGGLHLKQLSDFPEPAHLEPHGSFDNLEQVACHHNAIKGGLEVHVDIPVRARVLVVAEGAGDVIAESLSFRSGQR